MVLSVSLFLVVRKIPKRIWRRSEYLALGVACLILLFRFGSLYGRERILMFSAKLNAGRFDTAIRQCAQEGYKVIEGTVSPINDSTTIANLRNINVGQTRMCTDPSGHPVGPSADFILFHIHNGQHVRVCYRDPTILRIDRIE